MKNKLMILIAFLMVAMNLKAGKDMIKTSLDDNPDFRYPQTVSAHAITSYDKAIRRKDYTIALQSLIQYALAETSRTDSAVTDVMQRCDILYDQCDRTDLRSVIRHLQSRMLLEYSYRDYTKLDSLLAESKQLHLEAKRLAKGLDASPKQLGDGLFSADAWGFRIIPTLYDYLLMYENDHWQLHESANDNKTFYQNWLSLHTGDEDLATQMYLEYMLLSWPGKNRYQAYKQYVARYPKSPYAVACRISIAEMECEEVRVSYREIVTSHEPIAVNVNVDNIHELTLTLYRIPQGIKADKNSQYQVADLEEIVDTTLIYDGEIPFSKRTSSATFPAQGYGRYIILPSFRSKDGSLRKDKLLNKIKFEGNQICVSDLACYVVTEGSECNRLVVVDRTSGAPVQGVDVKLTLYPHGRNPRRENGKLLEPDVEVKQYRTEADGLLEVRPNVKFDYSLALGEDHYLPDQKEKEADLMLADNSVQIGLYLDLGIYRPGETLRGTAIVYQKGISERKPLANKELELSMYDASHNLVDTLHCQTDEMGQAVFSAPIPTDRMNGQWSLSSSCAIMGNTSSAHPFARGYVSFQVSEYKAPTFLVDMSETSYFQQTGKSVEVRGRATTFSGMPVADAEVKLTLSRRAWWWRYSDDFDEKQMTAKTDEQGHFVYTCPAEWFPSADATGYRSCFTYLVQATCTNTAGETHDASCSFQVGKARALSLSDGEYLLPDKGSIKLPVRYSSSEAKPEPVPCHYVLSLADDTSHVIMEGDFMSDQTAFEWSSIPSGCYRFVAEIKGDTDAPKADAELILYRENDKMPAVDRTLWIPQPSRRLGADGKTDILIGTSTGCHIYYISQSRTRVQTSGWLHYKSGMHHLRLPMPMDADEYLDITLVTLRDGESTEEHLRLDGPRKSQLHLAVTTFRDKVHPGQQEKWSFRLTDELGKSVPSGRMLLEAYSQALELLAPNTWSLSAPFFESSLTRIWTSSVGHSYTSLRYQESVPSVQEPKLPSLWLYNRDFFQMVEFARGSLLLRAPAAAAMPLYENVRFSAEDDMAMAEEEEVVIGYASMKKSAANDAVAETEPSGQESEVPLRTGDVHVALWEPRLESDAEGNISVTFDVPQQNTTWVVQALAYSNTLTTDRWSAHVLAQRPLMVQPVLPRFLRQGDLAELKAQVLNATDETQTAHVVIELFDPRTLAVMQTMTRDLEVKSQGTEVVGISCKVPVDVPYIGFRVRAVAADGSGDGEQQLLPVASDISPVIETHPIYMQPDVADYEQPLSQAARKGRVTLEFCANPTWYCVTALPTLIDEDAHTSTALAHSLYGISLAETLAKSRPEIHDAISEWMRLHQSDSAAYDPLLSPLEQNADLKIGTLKASPWLSAAQWQSHRMSQLDLLFDHARNPALYDRLINRLTTLQLPDGGFAWFYYDGCKSSPWTTQVVAELIGELRHLGCLTDDQRLTEMAHRAVRYLEQDALETERRMKKENRKGDIYAVFESFAYVRSLYQDDLPVTDRRVANIIAKALDSMEKNWGNRSLSQKAFTAITLHRQGRTKVAKSIIESIRQFALVNPAKGMYWERLSDGYWFEPVAATATILQAMAEIDPRTDELNKIRQWLLLEKQTSDWGGSSLASDAIYALLSTGDDWLAAPVQTADEPAFRIDVDGQPIALSPSDLYLGYVRMDLPSDTRQVAVHRATGNPAWGAIYHQYVAPMAQVKAVSIPELSVNKEFQVRNEKGEWVPVKEIHVGQRIRVSLSVHADKAFEFVTLHDERPALMEPVDQTSHYAWNERCGYFHETKDRETNLFITYLPAGNHIFTYECDVTHEGEFSVGIATIQSQYAPQYTAHSAGSSVQCR